MTKKFCGSCGELIKKKKQVCEDCGISIREFKKPYNRMPPHIRKGYIFFIAVGFIWLSTNLYIWLTVPGSGSSLASVFIFVFIFSYYHLQFKDSVKSGFKSCIKCGKNSSLNADYCIHCGQKIRWRYKPAR